MSNVTLSTKIFTKFGRMYYRNRHSEPFLSGDLFSKKADFRIQDGLEKNPKALRDIRSAKVIFCKGDSVEDFLDKFGSYLKNKVLIVGNSDIDWLEFPDFKAPGISAVFLQNSFVTHPRIHTLPIGIENISYFRNGRPRNFSDSFILKEKTDKVLVGPFSPTHPVREKILRDLKESSRIEILGNQPIVPLDYAAKASGFGYVASPRGNGEDTHRFWESLYRGCSPVVLRNNWSLSLERLNLPFFMIEEWNNGDLEKLRPFESFNPIYYESLWWPFWRKKINDLI